MVQLKIDQEHLEKLEIIHKLRMQKGILDCTRTYDLDALASRLACNPVLLLEVLESMGIELLE